MTRTIRSFCALGAVLLLSAGLTAQTLGDFRSKVTGDWNSLGTWFYWNGSGWVDAFATPTDLSGVITIMPGHVVTVIDNRSADQLIVSSGGTLTLSSGTLTVPDGAGIDLDVNGSLNLSGGSISTTGALRLNGGALNWNAGTIGGGGSLTIASGTVTQNTPWTNNSIALVVDFGTWNTTLGNGTTIAPGGTLTWNSGTIAGPGGFTVDAAATITLTTGNNKTLNSTLTNSGTINWGAGTWIGTGSVQNAAGGVFNINFDSFGQLQVPVVNSGAVNHTSIGSFSTSSTFTNSSGGSVNVNAGTWTFATAWSNGGTLNIPTGRTLFVTSAGSLNAGSAFTGAGTFSVSSTVTQNTPLTNTTSNLLLEVGAIWNTTTGNGTTIAPGGTLTWNSGTIAGPGGFTVDAGATATLATGSNKSLNSTLTNSGTINWGAGTWIGSGSVQNATGGVFNINFDGFGQLQVPVVNSGAVNHTSSGNFTTSTTFTNSSGGSVNVNAGTWTFGSTSSHTGLLNIGAGRTLTFSVTAVVGGTVTNAGTFAGTITSFTGSSFTNSGSVTLTNLPFAGSAVQTLDGSGSINTLTINNANGVTLGGTQTINTNLTLTSGRITLGNNNLLLGTSATLTGGTAANYCVTNGTGILRRRVPNTATNVLYPVGLATSYLPVNVQLTAGSTADDFSVRVESGVSSSYDLAGTPTGTPLTTHSTQTTWHINEAVATGSNATVQVQWNVGQEGTGFSRATSTVARYTGSAWEFGAFAAATGSDPYTRSRSGITNFSPFTVSDNVDSDTDGTVDFVDLCPNDANKIAPGVCGCGVADSDTDTDGTADCIDGCPFAVDGIVNFDVNTCACALGYYATITDMDGNDVITACTICPPGSYCPDGIDQFACAVGYFSDSFGQIVCNACSAGTFSAVTGSIECQSCAAGYFNPTTAATECLACVAGTFSALTGSVECQSCAAGYYNPTTAATECLACVAGTFSDVTGSIACTPCAAGYANNTTAATACSACPPGSFSANLGQVACDLCPVNTYNPSVAQTSCLACPNGETSTVGSVACVADGPCTDVTLELQTDGNPDQTTWEIRNEDGTVLVASGGPLVAPFGVQTQFACLPHGCFILRVFDAAGDGMTTGGYVLRTLNTADRLIDNRNNFSSGTISAISGGQGFCLPMSSDKVIFSSCDKLDWVSGQYVVATPNAAVSAQWLTGVQTDDGYEFWIFDPNGSYSFRRFRNHATSDGFGPASATRACHMKLNNWAAVSHVPANTMMNVRVRARVNAVNGQFGPACRLAIDPALAACPQTQLMNVPGDPNFSCGATRQWGTGNLVHARPVSGANRYQFRFRIVAEGFSVTRTMTTYFTQLNWAVLPLQDGKTYDVDVRVSKDGGATWCSASDPWGPVCQLTIDNTPANSGNQNFAGISEAAELRMFPNPNRGDVLNFSISAIEAGVNTVSVNIYDLTGKRMSARTIAVTDGNVNTVLDLQGELAAGMYLVNITAGDKTYTERLMIQP